MSIPVMIEQNHEVRTLVDAMKLAYFMGYSTIMWLGQVYTVEEIQ